MNKTDYLATLHQAASGETPPWTTQAGISRLEMDKLTVEVYHTPNVTAWRLEDAAGNDLNNGHAQTRMQAVREALLWADHYVRHVLFNELAPTC